MKENKSKLVKETERAIAHTAAALLPLYTDTAEDTPEGILGSYPNTSCVVSALQVFIDVMFPGRLSPCDAQMEHLDEYLAERIAQGVQLLRPEVEKAIPFRWLGEAARVEGAPEPINTYLESHRIMHDFCARLPEVRKLLIEDVKAAYEGDPAALTYAVVKLAYPGVLAITSHRLAHELYKLDVPIIARIMSEWIHAQTGVDINAGAQIGRGFFIDHATGVVVGETAVVGNNVKIYQGVTIGAKSFPLDDQGHPIKHIKRHPTVEDDVIIYANATILGGDTVIGAGSTIGGNVFLTDSVEPNSLVQSDYQATPKILKKSET